MPRALVFVFLAIPLVGAYAMYASGIVVIYRASRVLNLAHGAMATVPAYVVYSLTRAGFPPLLALPVGVAAGAMLGIAIERFIVRRLRDISPTAQTVGTIAVYGLLIALVGKVWGGGGLEAPAMFGDARVGVGSSFLTAGQIGIAVVAIVATGVLAAVFRYTWLGLGMRGAADNRRAASLVGVDPERASTVAWAIGGALAALAGSLLAAVTALHPYTLSVSVLPAFVAALIGGMHSLPGALAGAAVVGGVIGLVPLASEAPMLRLVFVQTGGPELALAVVAMIVMVVRGRRLSVAEASDAPHSVEPAARARPQVLRLWHGLVLIGIIVWVWLIGMPFTLLGDARDGLIIAVVASSLVLLTGWVGQISLAQAAFVGVGAFSSVQITERLGIQFPFTIPLAALVAAAIAVVLGAVALRVRGLYLAVGTLIFGWMADQYLFGASWLVGSGGSATARIDPIGAKGGFPYFDLADRRTLFTVALAATALVFVALANLRRSKTGRALESIRGSETAAASLGVDVARYKLMAFALSGLIAGAAGTLLAASGGTIVPRQFGLTFSLFYLSVAVVGGMRSLGGVLASAALFAGLNELFFRVDALHGWIDVVTASLLMASLLFYPGGLSRAGEALARSFAPVLERFNARPASAATPRAAGVGDAIRAMSGGVLRLVRELRGVGRELALATANVATAAERRAPAVRPAVRSMRAEARALAADARGIGRAAAGLITRASRTREPAPAPERVVPGGPLLEVLGVGVRFGGLEALKDVEVAVMPGRIVGLIGPNGAGKTTLFNVVTGLLRPDHGRVLVAGEDVTDLPVHERAARGLGRTFQQVQLVGDLTVRENLLVATHIHNPTGLLSHLVVTTASAHAEAEASRRVRNAAELVGVTEHLDTPAGSLPYGTLRMVELARALATGAPLVMLDEPAAGLDEHETKALGELLRKLRDDLGIGLLLIEHDIGLVTEICDLVWVLDRGEIIATGPPAEVRRDPAVIAAYLGEPN